ncbi:MAG: hypothetical protein ACRCUY_12185 [Thermoguttaceae bacterium]
MKHFHFFVFTLIFCCIIGCAKNLPMGGKVTFDDDQSPLTAGMVFFATDTFQARGLIQPDGTYQLGSVTQKDGLPPGTYQVYVAGASVEDPRAKPGDTTPPLQLIDAKYESSTTSGLSVNVDGSTRKFDFSVTRNPVTAAILTKHVKKTP